MIILVTTDVKSFSSSNIISIKQLQLCTGPILTDSELQFLRDNYNKLTYDELATSLKRSKKTVSNRVASLKLRKSGTRWTPAEVLFI